MSTPQVLARGARIAAPAVNKLVRNTYILLALTLMTTAITAGVSIAANLPHPGLLITLGGYFGLLFLTTKFRESPLGLAFVFALTGFMGFTMGPMINAYLGHFVNGGQLVAMAFGGTAIIFLGLSAYALSSRKDFSFMGGFLTAGILVAFLAGIGAVVFHLPGLSLAVSAMFMVLMAGVILMETSQLVNGGETNYIMATVSLYVAIFNLFTSLLQLLGFSMGDE